MDKPLKKPKLTAKEALFVRAKAEGKSNREAGLIAGAKTPTAADVYANRMLDNVKVKQSITELMDEKGLSDDKLLDILQSGLDATKPNEFTGEVLDDHNTRHKYLKTALELRGHIGKVGSTLNVQTTGDVKIIPLLGGASLNALSTDDSN